MPKIIIKKGKKTKGIISGDLFFKKKYGRAQKYTENFEKSSNIVENLGKKRKPKKIPVTSYYISKSMFVCQGIFYWRTIFAIHHLLDR